MKKILTAVPVLAVAGIVSFGSVSATDRCSSTYDHCDPPTTTETTWPATTSTPPTIPAPTTTVPASTSTSSPTTSTPPCEEKDPVCPIPTPTTVCVGICGPANVPQTTQYLMPMPLPSTVPPSTESSVTPSSTTVSPRPVSTGSSPQLPATGTGELVLKIVVAGLAILLGISLVRFARRQG